MAGNGKLDDAARAGWLYYIAGNTQDEIAKQLGVSRQSAQRLVAMAMNERLIKVHLDHPIGRCMDLARQLREAFALKLCEIVPSDPGQPGLTKGVAIAAAAELERVLKSEDERIVAFGTGRTLREIVEQVPQITCPQHHLVSRLGNIMADGSATPYNVVIRLAERVGARHYPMPLTAFVDTVEELEILHAREPIRNTLKLCQRADATFVGVGQLGQDAPVVLDGFISSQEMAALQSSGAVGEITSWAYDAEGRLLDPLPGRLATSAPLDVATSRTMIGVAAGPAKAPAIHGALRGRLINGLITDERTAEVLLGQ